MSMRLPALVSWLLLAAGCAAPAPESGTQPIAASPLMLLPLHSGTIHVLVDDLDQDGRKDLLFTSHGGNYARAFFQREGRRFEGAPQQGAVGFHPNDLIRLPGPEQRYLSCGEGRSRLNVFGIDRGGELSLINFSSQNQPRAAVPFHWPDWPRSLAVVAYDGDRLTLVRDFDPESGNRRQTLHLTPHPGERRVGTPLAADLDGDGIDEIYFTVTEVNELWRLRYPGTDVHPAPELIKGFGAPIHASRHLALMDVDADGRTDILVSLETGQRFEVLLNDGAGGFAPGRPIPYPYRPGPYSSAAGVDRDGSRLLAAGTDQAFALYRFSEGADYDSVAFRMRNEFPTYIVLEDLDGDGWLDLAASRGGRTGTPSGMVIFGPLWPAFQAQAVRSPIPDASP